MWIWVLSITVLGSNPEHIHIAKFETKQECKQAEVQKYQEYSIKNQQIVTRCWFTKQDKTGWW